MLSGTSRRWLVIILAAFALVFFLISISPSAVRKEPLVYQEPEGPGFKSGKDNKTGFEWKSDNIADPLDYPEPEMPNCKPSNNNMTRLEWRPHRIPETIAIQKVPGKPLLSTHIAYQPEF
jgi:hypothetical protein